MDPTDRSSSSISNVMQALAIVFAGVFGYYKFLRGRTFAYRAELSASTEIVQVDRGDALRFRAILRNTGPARIPMRLKRLRVSALVVSAPAEFVWERVRTVDALRARGIRPETVAMDKGYDNNRVYAECEQRECEPVIPLRGARGKQLAMPGVGGRLFPRIPRHTQRFRDLYRGRAAVEREFGRLKHDYGLARFASVAWSASGFTLTL